MVKLRLTRLGRKKRPFYRIVAVPVDDARDGAVLGQVGTYDPINATLDVDEEAAVQWLNNGAQMTNTVEALLRSRGVLARWRGLEGRVRDDVLLRDKPKRRRKLGQAAAAAEEQEGEAEEAVVQESASIADAAADAVPAEEEPAEEAAPTAEKDEAAVEEDAATPAAADEEAPAEPKG